jgi:cytochrome b
VIRWEPGPPGDLAAEDGQPGGMPAGAMVLACWAAVAMIVNAAWLIPAAVAFGEALGRALLAGA